MLKKGELIFDRYRVEKFIGSGAFGEVYLVTHIRLGTKQAMKLLVKNEGDVESHILARYRERFLLEARLAAKIRHPNIVRVYDFEEQDDQLALFMDYAPGGDLARYINKAVVNHTPIPIEVVVNTGLCISKGLAELHQHDIVHRDLKPSNILFDEKGDSLIADLGIAQTPDGVTTRTHIGGNLPGHPGTPAYMSPEQVNTKGYLTPSSDVYALGLILFEMLTGRKYKSLPKGTDVRDLRPDTPIKLSRLIGRLLQENPDKRLWDGSAVHNELQKVSKTPKNVVLLFIILMFLVMTTTVAMSLFSAKQNIFPFNSFMSYAIPTFTHTAIQNMNRRETQPSVINSNTPNPTKRIIASPSLTITPLPYFTITKTNIGRTLSPSHTISLGMYKGIFTANGNVRTGPGTYYNRITTLPIGQEVEVIGRSEDGMWLVIKLPESISLLPGWVQISMLDIKNSTSVLKVYDTPSTETPISVVNQPRCGANENYFQPDGDANGDCRVDGVDYDIWRDAYKTTSGEEGFNGRADFNGDGVIDGIDYMIWRSYYGQKCECR